MTPPPPGPRLARVGVPLPPSASVVRHRSCVHTPRSSARTRCPSTSLVVRPSPFAYHVKITRCVVRRTRTRQLKASAARYLTLTPDTRQRGRGNTRIAAFSKRVFDASRRPSGYARGADPTCAGIEDGHARGRLKPRPVLWRWRVDAAAAKHCPQSPASPRCSNGVHGLASSPFRKFVLSRLPCAKSTNPANQGPFTGVESPKNLSRTYETLY